MPANPDIQSGRTLIREDRDGDRDFVFHPENDDLFVRTGKQVIEHCRLGIGVEAWLKELKSMVDEVATWCGQRSPKVRACYVAPLTSRVTLFFVPSSASYDFDLGAELAELNTQLVQQYNLGMVETRQIPWDERERFIRAETSRPVYGDPERSY